MVNDTLALLQAQQLRPHHGRSFRQVPRGLLLLQSFSSASESYARVYCFEGTLVGSYGIVLNGWSFCTLPCPCLRVWHKDHTGFGGQSQAGPSSCTDLNVARS